MLTPPIPSTSSDFSYDNSFLLATPAEPPSANVDLDALFVDLFGSPTDLTVPMVPEEDPAETQRFLDSLYCLDTVAEASVEPVTPAQNIVKDFLATLGEAGRTDGVGLTTIPELFNCSRGTHVLELLPTAFVWLTSFKLGHELPLLAGYARYMDRYFRTSQEIACHAALMCGAAFLAVQRFDSGSSVACLYDIDILFCAIAACSNLAQNIADDSAGASEPPFISPHHLAEKQQILDRINNLTPQLRPFLKGSGFYNVARIAAQEVWRQTALIHYHQVLDHLAPDHPVMQTCLENFLKVYTVVEQGLPGLLIGPMTLSLFLASTVAITPQQQYRLRGRHELLHEYCTTRDTARFIERLWRSNFEKGVHQDWHKLAEREEPLCYI
ncbi:hypothetical protein MNV49_001750 [Pseudohyphozyma bogoriensis]|nr:hypothetical protein MNV49_001750 [Pseudohyphozyma bogoriensis]